MIQYIKANFGLEGCKQHVQGGDSAMFNRNPKIIYDKQYQKLADTLYALLIKGIYDGKRRNMAREKVTDDDYTIVRTAYQQNDGDIVALQNITSADYDPRKVCEAMLNFLKAIRMTEDETRYRLSMDLIAENLGEE
jgi:hypothetical protein